MATFNPSVAETATARTTMTTPTWKGKIAKLEESIGPTTVLRLQVTAKVYAVHYTSMKQFEPG